MFAAAAAGVPVIVANPSTPGPSRVPADLPSGTFLVAVTSGTSGHPRPVLRTAASWTASFAPLAELAGIGPDDRVLLTGPLHATLHLFAAVHTLAVGAELTDQPANATAVHAVPAVLADLLDALPTDAPLRTAVVAGTRLPADIATRAAARGIAVTEYYGAAELSFVAAGRYPEPLRPFPGAEVQIRGGELWVRSPYLAIGYPAGVTGPLRRDADGFATVGDLADRTADGALLIRGRGDAAITTGGATVVAEDVEDALIGLPGVAAVAVVGSAASQARAGRHRRDRTGSRSRPAGPADRGPAGAARGILAAPVVRHRSAAQNPGREGRPASRRQGRPLGRRPRRARAAR